jgi:hypothetical protein
MMMSLLMRKLILNKAMMVDSLLMGLKGIDEDEKLIEETKDSNFADAMNKILASSVDGKVGNLPNS